VGAYLPWTREGDPTADDATFACMSMRNLLVAVAITGLFLGILLLAGTVQNEGCLPWQEPLKTGGGVFSEGDRGRTVCR
jgi:hypothetical protein